MRLPAAIIVALAFIGLQAATAQDGQAVRIFFDWGKPELTRDAEATLQEVAAAFRQSQPARVHIAGHSDRSGPADVNLAASRRRAEAVKSHLIANGIPADRTAVSAFGESRPIVPTEDGVREAQNRRVDIRFEGGTKAVAAALPLVRADGSAAGSASLSDRSLTIEATGLPAGVHGLHLHAVGRCDAPDFTSAGPHWNPTNREHGSENPAGPHLGDLPNLTVGPDGRGGVTLAVPPGLLDGDGAALVIHAEPDDYRTDPSGNSGARIACAVLKAPK